MTPNVGPLSPLCLRLCLLNHFSVFVVISTGCVCLTSISVYGVFIYICLVITLYIAKFPEDDTDDNSVNGDPLLEQHQISAVNVGVS